MQEAYIHLPEADNNGASLIEENCAVGELLLEAFGGYSAMEAKGAWRDPATGAVYIEPVSRIAVAADWNDPANVARMLEIAGAAADMMRQVCVYVSLPGGVSFVEPKARKAA